MSIPGDNGGAGRSRPLTGRALPPGAPRTGQPTQPPRPPPPAIPPTGPLRRPLGELQPSRIVLPSGQSASAAPLPSGRRAAPGRGRRIFDALCLRPLGICGRMLLFMLPLLALAVGALWLRIMYSPIAVDFLAAPIERALNAELTGLSVGIEGAVLHRSERGGIEVRLRKLRLVDRQGGTLAAAAWAGVEISLRQLLSARLAPVRVELIEPRVLLAVDAEGHVAVEVGDSARDAARPAGDAAPPQGEGPGAPAAVTPQAPVSPSAAGNTQPLALGRLLAETMQRMRQAGDASDHLRTVGMRDAVVTIAGGGQQAVWRVPTLAVDLRQKQRQQWISGSMRVAGAAAGDPWALGFRIEAVEAGSTIRVTGDLAGLVPSGLAGLPGLAALATVEVPLTATGSLDLAADGGAIGWRLAADLGEGRVGPEGRAVAFRRGRLELRYASAERRLDLMPSPLELDGGRLTLSGSATPHDDGGWRFGLATRDASVAGRTRAAPPFAIGPVTIKGAIGGRRTGVDLDEVVAGLAGTTITAAGRIDGSGLDLAGSAGPLTAQALREALPRGLWPVADEALERLHKGTLTVKAFRIAPAEAKAPPQLSLTIEGQDVEVELARGLPPLEAARALLRLDGNALEITVPEAHVAAGSGASRRITLRGGRIAVAGLDATPPVAEISGRIVGQLPAFLDLADREPLRLFKGAGPPHPGIDGKVDAQLKTTLPLAPDLRLADVRVEGRTRITDGRIKDVVGPHDVTGATLAIEASGDAVDFKGELLLAGVHFRIAGGLDPAAAERRPLVELTARLDRVERGKLGLDLEHLLDGEVPIRVLVRRDGGETPKVQVIADLTPAEVAIHDINWKKPAGRPARLNFDVAKGPAAKGLELQNFKVVGDNVAIEGWVGVGADNKVREYYFPEFSINVVTNLAVRGKLRPDRVWEVVARGKAYDASDLFRSFYTFDAGAPHGPKNRPGVDLDAEIETVIGMGGTTLRGVRMTMQQRAEKLVAVELAGTLEGGKAFAASLRPQQGRPRILYAQTADAGQALRLVGFYQSMVGGTGELTVNLDGKGAVEKSGEARIRRFQLLGDAIVAQVFESVDESRPAIGRGTRPSRREYREQFDFEKLVASVSVGNGQLALENVLAEGPLIGVSLRGKIDFGAQRMQLGGTYVPLSGVNRALSGIPLIGQILTGPRGEGIFGITFLVEGQMARPNVLVNPLSILGPGVFRELFQMTPENPTITPKAEPRPARSGGPQVRSSPPADGSAGAAAGTGRQQQREPEVLDGWSATSKKR